MTAQLELFPAEVDINPTPAMRAGKTYVARCSWCGLQVCAARGVPLRPCPACDGWTGWWEQTLPVGPFVERGVPRCGDCHRRLEGAAKRTPSAAPPDEG